MARAQEGEKDHNPTHPCGRVVGAEGELRAITNFVVVCVCVCVCGGGEERGRACMGWPTPTGMEERRGWGGGEGLWASLKVKSIAEIKKIVLLSFSPSLEGL